MDPSSPLRYGSTSRLPAVRGSEAYQQQGTPSPRTRSAGGLGGSVDLDEANPFTLPREDVFLLREREKGARAAERERLASTHIWDKPAKSGQLLASTQQIIAASYEDKVQQRQKYLNTVHAGGSGAGPLAASAPGLAGGAGAGKDRLFQGRRREKENMADFIAKKRDMFLIQMSLDTKRAEIQKLEEKAQMKEDALKKSEMMLEEDAMRFDAFLKENDRKAHDALKRADLETKEKQEKVLEIKKLNAEISKVENEMSKYEEQLLACMKYKDFLDSLTPQEHWAKIARRKEERAKARHARAQAGKRLSSGGHLSGDEKENLALHTGEEHGADGLSDDSSDDDEVMYFEKPEQLLEIFAQLEERNLFLIQNVQETEEALDDLNTKFEETKKAMEEKTDALHASIADLRTKIRVENEKAEALKKRARANSVAGTQQKLLAGLSEKVTAVYAKCGMDPDTQTDTLDMLRDIEQWLEVLLLSIHGMDPVKVEFAEKKKNGERRNQIRALKKDEQQRAYEERLAKSTARATAEVVKRTGKQVMFRSPPLRKKKKKEDVVTRDEEAEELKRFFT